MTINEKIAEYLLRAEEIIDKKNPKLWENIELSQYIDKTIEVAKMIQIEENRIREHKWKGGEKK